MPYKDKEKANASSRRSWKKNYPKNRLKSLEDQRRFREKCKLRVIDFYSKGKRCCNCCGETILEFLTVDHINNNGTQERKKYTGGGHHNYRYIINNNFPEGYQILCFNCNCGRARRKDKICPHKLKIKNLNI